MHLYTHIFILQWLNILSSYSDDVLEIRLDFQIQSIICFATLYYKNWRKWGCGGERETNDLIAKSGNYLLLNSCLNGSYGKNS